jgi:hypothetical protein
VLGAGARKYTSSRARLLKQGWNARKDQSALRAETTFVSEAFASPKSNIVFGS